MLVQTDGMMIFEKGEPAFRSCPECNAAHEHLKDTKFIHLCFVCNRYWINGRYLSDMSEEEFIDFMRECEKDDCAVKVIEDFKDT